MTVGQTVAPSFTDRGLASGTRYTYAIRAFSAVGVGAAGPDTGAAAP